MKIPKKIHQIWFQGESNIPAKYLSFQQSWIQNHPDWSYHLWDENTIQTFLNRNYLQLREIYHNFPYMHQKIDFFKYLILLDQGGLYADMDSESLKSINGLIKKFPQAEVLISEAAGNSLEHYFLVRNTKMLNNGILLSRPKHPFFKYLIHKITQLSKACGPRDSKIKCIEKTTGPQLFTKVGWTFLDNNPKNKGFTIISSKYLEPCFGLDETCEITSDAYANHDHNLTWLYGFQIKLIQLYLKAKQHYMFALFLLIIMIYLFIYYRNSI